MVQYTSHAQFNKFKSSTTGEIDRLTVADLRGSVPSLRPKIFSISCSFLENLTQFYTGASPRGSAPPPTGNPESAPGLILLTDCVYQKTSTNWLTPLIHKFVIKMIQILNSSVVKFCSLLVSGIKILGDISPFCWSLIPLFWTLPLVRHPPTCWRLAWRLSLIRSTYLHMCTGIGGT